MIEKIIEDIQSHNVAQGKSGSDSDDHFEIFMVCVCRCSVLYNPEEPAAFAADSSGTLRAAC